MKFRFFICLALFLLIAGLSKGGPAQPATHPAVPTPPPGEWKLTKEKIYPLYKVQIFSRTNSASPSGTEMKAAILDKGGKTLAEVKSLMIEPDPREIISGWTPGTLLDLDKDGNEDLVLRLFSGGAHCCFSYQIYSLGKMARKMGDLKLHDCGETIELKDVNGDGVWEILACNAAFTYLKKIPFSQSPFPPTVFGLEGGKYVNQDKKLLRVFDDDIVQQRKIIQEKGFAEETAIQIVLDYLLSGREEEAWKNFDELFANAANKEDRKAELKERWDRLSGIKVESKPAESKPREGKLP